MEKVFVSYNSVDRRWSEWIAWQLENAGYRAILQAWDFRPGANFALEMQRAASEADRTIAVLSEAYLKSRFTQPEWAAAFVQDPTGEKKLLIPVRIEECELKGLLPAIVYIDLVGISEEQARELLIAGIHNTRAKPNAEPPFPGWRGERDAGLHDPGVAPAFPGRVTARGGDVRDSQPASVAGAAVATSRDLRPMVDLEFPAVLFALEPSAANVKFHVAKTPARVAVEFRQWQPSFIISTTYPQARKQNNGDADAFELEFNEAGEYGVRFDLAASKLEDLNNLITVVIRSDQVLLRRDYRVTALSGKADSRPAAILRLLEWGKDNWRMAWPALAVGLLGVIAFLVVKHYTPNEDWQTALGLRPPDYIRAGKAWRNDFDPDHWFRGGGVKITATEDHPLAPYLEFDGAGYASPRLNLPDVRRAFGRTPSFHDFEAVFNISFRQQGAAHWIFRGAKSAATGSGYYFTLTQRLIKVKDEYNTQFDLSGRRCSDSGNCDAELGKYSYQVLCACNQASIQALAARGKLRLIPTFTVDKKGCNSFTGDPIPFDDNEDSHPYGQLVFFSDNDSHFDIGYLLMGGLNSELFQAAEQELKAKP